LREHALLDALFVSIGKVDVLDLDADDPDRPRDRGRDRVGDVDVEPGTLLNGASGVVLAKDGFHAGNHARVEEPRDGDIEGAVLLVKVARIHDLVRDADGQVRRLLVARVGLERRVAGVLVLHGDLANRVDPRKLEVRPGPGLADGGAEPQHDGALALIDDVPRSEHRVDHD